MSGRLNPETPGDWFTTRSSSRGMGLGVNGDPSGSYPYSSDDPQEFLRGHRLQYLYRRFLVVESQAQETVTRHPTPPYQTSPPLVTTESRPLRKWSREPVPCLGHLSMVSDRNEVGENVLLVKEGMGWDGLGLSIR